MTDKKSASNQNPSLFGTDGVRGVVNSHPITADMVLTLAQALGTFAHRGEHSHRIVIGKDTRLSGYMLEPALTSGFISSGCDVFLAGPIPTPAIPMLTKSLRADMGIMISASHNPYCDNGIKIFRPDGLKLSDKEEAIIQDLVQNPQSIKLADPTQLGRAKRLESARGRYIEYIKATFPNDLRLDGLKIVADCAHGAGYKIAPTVLYELGADVIPIAVDPNGRNINHECGVLHPQSMCQAVIDNGADFGLALDGDADRLLLCDHKGRIFNGDKILAIIARYYADRNSLKGAVISTVMANLGLQNFLDSLNIKLLRTGVGDRQVIASMLENNSNLGGEQSGHIILGDYGHVGDALLASLQVLAAILHSGQKLADFHDIFDEVPQKIINIRINGDNPLEKPDVNHAIEQAQASLATCGRILVRASGTEPVIRLMGEAHDEKLLSEVLGSLQKIIEAKL